MKVGDRVKAASNGWCTTTSLRNEVIMQSNEEGTITNIMGGEYCEILLNSGKYVTRLGKPMNIKIIKSSELQYEIY